MSNLIEFLKTVLTLEWVVFVTAALPIIELRGAIPVGIALGMAPWQAYVIGVLGSMLPVPFILLLIKPIFHWLKENTPIKPFIEKITHRTLNKSDNINKYGFWGLLIFVAIPLPGTGVWSGALAAALLELKFKTAMLAIFLGNAVAGLIMMTFSQFFFG